MRLEDIKGLGKARLEALHKAGIRSVADLLLTLPSSYQNTLKSTPIASLCPGKRRAWKGLWSIHPGFPDSMAAPV